MTLNEILDIYAGYLIIQYKNKEKAKAETKLIANCSVCDQLAQLEKECWDLETALGSQLTILGKIVGVPRSIIGLDLEHTFFNFTRYSGTPTSIGFGRYSDIPYSSDIFDRYENDSIYTLTDFELRTLIKLKIIYNTKISSMKYLTEALYSYFGTDISLSDNGISKDVSASTFFSFTRYSGTPDSVGFGLYADDPYPSDLFDRYVYHYFMTIMYQVKKIYELAFEAGIYLDIIPRPMGCAILVNYVN